MLAPGLAPGAASASLLHGETLDSLPMGMAWFAVIAMPIVGIAIFWQLHVLPGKIAAKRHHPQKDAIHVLRLLLLAFGGLLWPMSCARGSRGGDLGRSQARRCASIAL